MENTVATLIVDDSAESRAWLKNRLETLGCTVVGEAASAAEGQEQFEALRPRLVTLDIMMPEVDGMSAMDLFLHISQKASEVGVLVISVRPLADSHEFLRLGAIGYLEKPFINFDEAAKLLRAFFPELEVKSVANGKRGGLSERLARRS
jgi:two-component system, chemotaxis family, chemotaxis protein CheY